MVALALLGSSATITIAWATSFFISNVFIKHASIDSVSFCLGWLAIAALVKGCVIWLQEFLAIRASAAVTDELRAKLFSSINRLGPGWLAKRSIAEANLLATSGLDALEPYFSKYLPQLVYTALVTPILVAIIWLSDFSSGVTLFFTLPLIPLFMILIGWATQAVQTRQLRALTALTQHFLEVLRGLTTLKIFLREEAQEESIERVSAEHRIRTMKVLRVSFLSGFTLELIASLAVALIAVSIGLRLLSGDLTLAIGLFVLLLAPEAFLPLRQVGAQFHASGEGLAASTEILDIIDTAKRVTSSEVRADFVETLSVELGSISERQFNVITGPSGIGKSSIFLNWLGLRDAGVSVWGENFAWLPQSSRLFSGSVAENIVGPGLQIDHGYLQQAIAMAALDDVAEDQSVGDSGSAVSGGQAQRICLARAFYRAQTLKTRYLLLDEPTSALDEGRAIKVVESIRRLAQEGFTVIAISHQESLIRAADRVIEVKIA